MSAFAFLHADIGPAGPIARSPMAREAMAAGARCETRDGWEVARVYSDSALELQACRETVGFSDLSHLGTLELQATPETLAKGFPRPGADVPGDGPAEQRVRLGVATRAQQAWWCPVTHERALVLCDSSVTVALRDTLERSFGGHVLDVTAAFAAFAITGPLARETLARFCALDLRPAHAAVGAFRPGSAGRTPAYLLREATERYLLMFGAAYASYMWEVVGDVATRQGGRPVGLDALDEAASIAGQGGQTHA